MKSIPIIILVVLLAHSMSCLWEDYAGPYYMRWKAMSKCRDIGKNSFVFPPKLRRVNRTHKAYRVNITLPFDLTNEHKVNIVINTKGTNNYSWNSLLNTTRPLCDFISVHMHGIMTVVLASAGHKYECPIKKGTYEVDYPIHDVYCNELPTVPVFPYGDCRMEASIYSGKGETYARETCLTIYFETRPLYEIRGGCPKRV